MGKKIKQVPENLQHISARFDTNRRKLRYTVKTLPGHNLSLNTIPDYTKKPEKKQPILQVKQHKTSAKQQIMERAEDQVLASTEKTFQIQSLMHTISSPRYRWWTY